MYAHIYTINASGVGVRLICDGEDYMIIEAEDSSRAELVLEIILEEIPWWQPFSPLNFV